MSFNELIFNNLIQQYENFEKIDLNQKLPYSGNTLHDVIQKKLAFNNNEFGDLDFDEVMEFEIEIFLYFLGTKNKKVLHLFTDFDTNNSKLSRLISRNYLC